MELTKEYEERILFDEDAANKLFLFREFTKLEELRNELEQEKKQLEKLRKELQQKEHSISADLKTLMDKELFFEKKMQILKDGFYMLEQDRRHLEIQKAEFESECKRKMNQNRPRSNQYMDAFTLNNELCGFFAGVNHTLAVKKRYKDLMKIYHPDNFCGDQEMLLKIQREYEIALEMFE